jgi:hypothetical protein
MPSTKYATLICAMPHHGSLFRSTRPPLSRIRLQHFLDMLDETDKADYNIVASLLDWSRQRRERGDDVLLAHARRQIPQLANDMARDLVEWRLAMRTVMAALRRRARGERQPPGRRDWGYGRWVPSIERNWQDPDFGLLRVYPWLPEARALLQSGQSQELERLLMQQTWHDLNCRSEGHEFDFEAVLIYIQRWDMVARWASYRDLQASTRFEYMVRDGLTGFVDPSQLAGLMTAG